METCTTAHPSHISRSIFSKILGIAKLQFFGVQKTVVPFYNRTVARFCICLKRERETKRERDRVEETKKKIVVRSVRQNGFFFKISGQLRRHHARKKIISPNRKRKK